MTNDHEQCDPRRGHDTSYTGQIATLRAHVERLTKERDAAHVATDVWRQAAIAMEAERDEARATNAALHRRAQGVEAGKPDDAETIRRLRREVVATAKHAKSVADRDLGLCHALSVANHSVVRLTAERDARPNITAEDAAAFADWRAGENVTTSAKGYTRVMDALREHARKVRP